MGQARECTDYSNLMTMLMRRLFIRTTPTTAATTAAGQSPRPAATASGPCEQGAPCTSAGRGDYPTAREDRVTYIGGVGAWIAVIGLRSKQRVNRKHRRLGSMVIVMVRISGSSEHTRCCLDPDDVAVGGTVSADTRARPRSARSSPLVF